MLLVGAALQDLRIISFWRTFGDLERAQWDELLECIALHNPSFERDAVTWHLESSGSFSTKSLYQAILPTPGLNELTVLWAIKLPLKIRILMWQWVRGRLPSGTEVQKRHGSGDGQCPLCDIPED